MTPKIKIAFSNVVIESSSLIQIEDFIRSKTKIPLEWTIHHHSSLFLYGTVDYLKPNGPNFKVNGHRVKAHFEGSYQDWIADKCISYKRRENQAKIVTTGHEWKSGCEDEAHQVKSNPEKKEAKKR
ncbi:hypothetical protein Tco_1212038 [Tanacetum coccineum]